MALPWLESIPVWGAGPAKDGTPGPFPKRFAALFMGNGINSKHWWAKGSGEEMELGDDRQLELHPPYVKCLGGDRCRCVQIALLSDGSEVEIDEVPDEAYDED